MDIQPTQSTPVQPPASAPVQTSPPPTAPKKRGLSRWAIVGVIIVMLAAFIGAAGYSMLNSESKNNDASSTESIPQEQVQLPTETVSTPTPTQKTVSCSSSQVGVSIDLPTDWSCEIKDHWMTLKSSPFTIDMSELGRGGLCSGPDCGEIVEFYSDDNIKLDMFKDLSSRKEIFGTFKEKTVNPNGSTWVSIKFDDMGKRELTSEEKNKILDIVKALKFTRP